jgi:uncharacterized protein
MSGGRATGEAGLGSRRLGVAAVGPSRTIGPMEPTLPLTLDRATARRFLVLRHLLAPPRSLPADPASVMAVVDRLGSLQFDPLDLAGRNHDLVLGARIAGYRRAWTDGWLYVQRALYETYNKGLSIVPTAEMPWYRITWDLNDASHREGTFDVHAPLVEELLERIRRDGPLAATDLEPRAAIDWYWRPTNQVRAILEALAEAGILGLSRRDGNRRVYDLVGRLFPADLLAERRPETEQRRHKLLSRYRAHGLLGKGGQAEIFMGTGRIDERRRRQAELLADGTLVPVEVDGVKGTRYIVAPDLPTLEAARAEVADGTPPGRTAPGVAFLAPLDPLVWDRDLLRRLWDFDYVWEVYVPEAKRRWGYYVLPILYGDALVGRIEPRFDRKAGTLRILAIWWEDGLDPLTDPRFAMAFADAVAALAATGDATRIEWPRSTRHRAFVRTVRAALAAAADADMTRGERTA